MNLMNLVYTLLPYFFKIRFNSILSSTPRSLLLRFLTEILHSFFVDLVRATCLDYGTVLCSPYCWTFQIFKPLIFQVFSPLSSYSSFLLGPHKLFLDLCSQNLSVRVLSRDKCSTWFGNVCYFRYVAGRQNFLNELWRNRSTNVICLPILYEFISWDAEATVFPVSLRCIRRLTQSYSNCVSRSKQIHFYRDLSDMNFINCNCVIHSCIFEWLWVRA